MFPLRSKVESFLRRFHCYHFSRMTKSSRIGRKTLLIASDYLQAYAVDMGVRTGEHPGETMNQNFLQNMKSAALNRIDLILAMTVYLPVWRFYFTRVRFTVLVSCSDELAVYSRPLRCLLRQVAKLSKELFYCASWQTYGNKSSKVHFKFR